MKEITEKFDTSTEQAELKRITLLAGLGDSALADLARSARWWRLDAGEVLFERGAPAGSLYLVHRGRLRFSTDDDPTGGTAEVAAGQTVGEIGLLANVPRTATVTAVRDSILISIGQEELNAVLETHPSAGLALARTVAARAASVGRPKRGERPGVVAVLDVNIRPGDQGATRLAHALARVVPGAAVLDVTHCADDASAVAASEQQHALTLVLLGDPPSHDGAGTEHRPRRASDVSAVHQADLILAVVDGERPMARIDERTLALLDVLASRPAPPMIEVVVRQPLGTTRPSGTPRVLDRLFPIDDATSTVSDGERPTGATQQSITRSHPVHHLDGTARTIDRLGRRLCGDRIGIVLSGGGARAMAHLGVIRTLVGAGLPIDVIGGTSMGAVVATAIGRAGAGPTIDDVDQVIERFGEVMPRLALGRRFTLPAVSLLSVRRARSALRDLLGDDDLTDAWIPTFVITGDLTRSRLTVVDRGPSALWARASASAPGLWPAVADPAGGLHVDGALFDNLPIAPMRSQGIDRIVASNVSNRSRFGVQPGSPQVDSPLAWLAQRVRRGPANTYPLLGKVLGRTVVAASLAEQTSAADLADAIIEPAVDHIGLTDYGTFSDAVTAGEAAARSWLESGPEMLETTVGAG